MRRNLAVVLLAGVTLGSVLTGAVGSGSAVAAPAPSVGASAKPAGIPPLDHGWVANLSEFIGVIGVSTFGVSTSDPASTQDSGPTAPGDNTSPNVLTGSMSGSLGTYHVQASLPVGQTFVTDRSYNSEQDSVSLVVSWPGGGCASTGFGGIAEFTVNQLTRAVSGAATTYAVQFLCFSSNGVIEGAFAYNIYPTTVGQGYYTYGSDGTITGFGNDNYLQYLGDLGASTLNAPIVGMATTPDGRGYWLAAADGGIFAYGDAGFYGSMGATVLNQPIVGMAATNDGRGYWMVAADGGIFAFGDAQFHGSMGGKPLDQPIVGMTPSPGGGYRMVAADGGIFSFDAAYYGSMGGKFLVQPIVGMTATPDGKGYWMVASDGGIFSFGDAGFYGSMGNIPLNEPIVGMDTSTDGHGYWLVAGDGGVFAFGDAPFYGSLASFSFSSVAGIAT